MDALLKARQGYSTSAPSVRTDRGTEYDAFARITHRMKAAPSKGMPELAAALHENRRLWALLASDAADNGNGLDDSLRARIVYLAEFTRQHSTKVLMRKASVDPLIEINSAVMAGLRDKRATA